MRYPHLFEPIQLNQLKIRNRIVSTAHAEVYAENGIPGERYIRYYEEKARGGVGLAICREMVHQLGGEIRIASTAGQGTRITVEFPIDAKANHSNSQRRRVNPPVRQESSPRP